MEYLFEKLGNFFINDELKVAKIQFLSLNAVLYQDYEQIRLNKKLPIYDLYITKQFMFDSVIFYFLDGGRITFALKTNLQELKQKDYKYPIAIENFDYIDADQVKGKIIEVFEDSILVNATLKNKKNIFDRKDIKHFYWDFKNISFEKESIDIRNIIIQKNKNNNCYIATLAYGDINHPKVEFLRLYRDQKLLTNLWGRIFVKFYYSVSPSLVKILKPFNQTHSFFRMILDFIIDKIEINDK